MDYSHYALIAVIMILVFIVYRFYHHYLTDIKYPCKFYPRFKFRTGDLVFFKSLQSFHKIFTNSYFSHIGIIVMKNNAPFVMELVHPNVKFFPLEERIKFYTEGTICIKQIDRELDHRRLAAIPHIIKWASKVKYTKDDTATWTKDCIGSIWDRSNPETDFECAKFIAYVMNKLDLIDKTDVRGCSVINYFEKLHKLKDNYSYGDIYNVCYIDSTTLDSDVQDNFRSIKNLGKISYHII